MLIKLFLLTYTISWFFGWILAGHNNSLLDAIGARNTLINFLDGKYRKSQKHLPMEDRHVLPLVYFSHLFMCRVCLGSFFGILSVSIVSFALLFDGFWSWIDFIVNAPTCFFGSVLAHYLTNSVEAKYASNEEY